MIPIKNKRKNLEVTIEEMRNFATAYVEKYAPSKQQLQTYLLKKYLKSSNLSVKKNDITDLIHLVTEDLKKNKFINDKFHSDHKGYLHQYHTILLRYPIFDYLYLQIHKQPHMKLDISPPTPNQIGY